MDSTHENAVTSSQAVAELNALIRTGIDAADHLLKPRSPHQFPDLLPDFRCQAMPGGDKL